MKAEAIPDLPWAKVESLRLSTLDGQELGAWFMPGRADHSAAMLLHGNGGSRANCLDQAEWMTAAGFPVLLITMRAHGDSTGERNDFGYSARADVIAGVDWLERKHPGHPIVWGRSMGSAAALFASRDLGHRVSGYVLECPYRDLRTAVTNRLRSRLPPPLSGIAYRGIRLMAPLILDDIDRISPLEASAGMPRDMPVLILAGGNDHRATPDEARAIASQIGNGAELIIFEGADHLGLASNDPGRYRDIGMKFLSSCRDKR